MDGAKGPVGRAPMKRPPAEQRAGFPWALAASLWGVFVLVWFILRSLRALPAWGKIFESGPPVPGAPGLVGAWMTHMGVVLTALAVLSVVWVLGRRVREWLGVDVREIWVRTSLDFLLGILLLGVFWIGMGLNALWFPVLWKGFGIPLLGLCLLDLVRRRWKDGTWTLRVFFPREAVFIGLFGVGVWYLLFGLLQGLAPETFYDSMVYHLAVPAYWLWNHGLVDHPANFFSNFPFAAETFFLNGLVLQGTEAAKMLHWASFGVAAVLAGGWAREMAGERAGWLVWAMIVTFPLLSLCAWTTQVEGSLALSCLAFLYALDRWSRGGGKGWALLTGLFAGCALATKYTALPVVLLGLLVSVLQRSSFWRSCPAREGALSLLGGVLTLGPWVVKNLVFTGNPFFPYLMGTFPGRRIPQESYLKLLEEQRFHFASDLGGILRLPWDLTMANPDSYVFVGPLALVLAPFLLLFRYRDPSLRFLAALVLPLFGMGLVLTHILKFSIPAFLVLYLVAGTALTVARSPFLAKAAAWGSLAAGIACFSYLAAIHHRHYGGAGLWAGKMDRQGYLQACPPVSRYQGTARWIADHLPPGERVLVAGGSRGLYLERPFLNQSVFDEQLLRGIVRAAPDAQGIREGLRRWGVDHLLVLVPEGLKVVDYRHYDLTSEEWGRLDDFIQRGTELVHLKDLQGLYRIKEALSVRPGAGIPDLMLFLSEPAAHFVHASREGRWAEAERELGRVLALYPFSEDWRVQARTFREARK